MDAILALADPDGTADLVVTEDVVRPPVDRQHRNVNLGNWFARDTPCANAVLSAMGVIGLEGGDSYWCIGQLSRRQDQCALEVVLNEAGLGDDLAGALRRVPHRTFNAMIPDRDFTCEDPVLHMPGCREEACANDLLQKCPLV